MPATRALRFGLSALLLLGLGACGSAAEDSREPFPTVTTEAMKPKQCLDAAPIDLASGSATVVGDTTRSKNKGQWCGLGQGEYYVFTLDALSAVYADTFGSSFDTELGLFADGCAAPSHPCADDACGTGQSQLVAVLPAGTHRILVQGAATLDRGPYVLHVEAVPVPSEAAGVIPRGPFELGGAIVGYEGGWLGACGRGSWEWYWYATCPGEAGIFTASTCNPETTFDAALAFVDARESVETCCDEPDPGDPAEACAGPLEMCPGQAAVRVPDGAEAGLHVLKVGAVGRMTVPQGEYRVTGERP
jgi:hypothetical protein